MKIWWDYTIHLYSQNMYILKWKTIIIIPPKYVPRERMSEIGDGPAKVTWVYRIWNGNVKQIMGKRGQVMM